jgi:DNA-directed RNA polymerase omega subunit
MRIQPYLDDLEEIVPSRYSMVIGVSKRARKLMEENVASPYPGVTKPVSVAMWEMKENKIKLIERPAEKKEETPSRRVQEFEDLDS